MFSPRKVFTCGDAGVPEEYHQILPYSLVRRGKRGQLRPESTPELERIHTMLATHRQIEKVLIAGHTDGIGNDDYNLELSKRRAESVKGYLVDKGIDGSRIETVGKGESEPVADNETEAARQMNRRVTLTLP